MGSRATRTPLEALKQRQRMLIHKWRTLAQTAEDPKEARIWLRCAKDLIDLMKNK
jgi:hypothetical protein